MKILHVTESINLSDGGTPRFVSELCKELADIDCEVTILSSKAGHSFSNYNFENLNVIPFPQTKVEQFSSICFKNNKTINSLHFKPDIIHLNGVWPTINLSILHWAKDLSIPIVMSPHACFLPGDMNKSIYNKLKKWVGWNLIYKDLISSCGSFHATALNELKSIKALNFRTQVANIQNGIDFKEFSNLPPDSIFRANYSNTIGKKIILFMSRIDPTKGLDLLAHAWGCLAKEHEDWHLVIAGQDKNTHWKKIKSIFDSHDLTNQYTYTGFLKGELRLSAYSAADLFILPSFRENFGFVIAEALMSGTPVITTTETPWEKLSEYNCGWIIEPRKEVLTELLNNILLLRENQLKTMGINGKKFIKGNYTWKMVAYQMKAFYQWILVGGQKPSFVTLLDGTRKAKFP